MTGIDYKKVDKTAKTLLKAAMHCEVIIAPDPELAQMVIADAIEIGIECERVKSIERSRKRREAICDN